MTTRIGFIGWLELLKERERKKKKARFMKESKIDFFLAGCIILGLLFLLIYGMNY